MQGKYFTTESHGVFHRAPQSLLLLKTRSTDPYETDKKQKRPTQWSAFILSKIDYFFLSAGLDCGVLSPGFVVGFSLGFT